VSLRLKLFAVSLLTLVLPWAGCTYVQEMEGALKSGVEQSLQGSAQTIAAALEGRAELLYAATVDSTTTAAPLLAHRLPGQPSLDGYRDDWGLADMAPLPVAPDPRSPLSLSRAHYWAGVRGRYLYLYVEVQDKQVKYSTPTQTGDHITIADGHGRRLAFTTAAPGPLGATLMAGSELSGGSEQRITGFWRQQPGGYALEIQAPLAVVGGRFNIHVIDSNDQATRRLVGTSSTYGDTGPIIYPRESLADTLAAYSQEGLRIRIVDRQGWLLADQGTLIDSSPPTQGGLLSRLYSWLLKPAEQLAYQDVSSGWLDTAPVNAALQGKPSAAWFSGQVAPDAIVQASQPLLADQRVMGAVVLERSSASMLTLTNQALTRLMNFTLLATLIAALGSVGYATALSLRVRRLARAAEEALGPRGELNSVVPGTSAGDELGTLARSFSRLLLRLGDYNDYLRGLAGKLSHELRTPLAVITSSLENLELEQDPQQRRIYQQRLHSGAQRLDRLVSAMSEATHMEQIVQDAQRVWFRPAAIVDASVRGYQDAYPGRRFQASCDDRGLAVSGSPDLLAQLLDKLVDNALSFAPDDGLISVDLDAEHSTVVLKVTNQGPTLPESMRGRLFDSLVSIRSSGGDKPHLGLGLFIVRLITDYHRGSATADNLADNSGVQFRVSLPGRRQA
jgi:two-component system sensor histidine kinase ChvG